MLSFSTGHRRRSCRRRRQQQQQPQRSTSAFLFMPFLAVVAAIAAVAFVATFTPTSSIGVTALIVVSRPGRLGGSGHIVGSGLSSSTKRCRHSPNYFALTTTTTTTSFQKSLLIISSSKAAKSSSSSLLLTPLDNSSNNDNDKYNLSDYSKQKQKSELDSLITKRQQIRQSKLANIKPNDDNPKIEEMSDEEIKEMLKMKGTTPGSATSSSSSLSSSAAAETNNHDGGGNSDSNSSSDGISSSSSLTSSSSSSSSTPSLDIDALFSRDYVPDFKTKRSSASFGSRAADATSSPPPSFFGGDDSDDDSDGKGQQDMTPLFVDWTADYEDENEFHIPNRIGFTTIDWADAKKGYVNGKLKKKDRKLGKYNQSDLKVRERE
jgi:hypothetical protein